MTYKLEISDMRGKPMGEGCLITSLTPIPIPNVGDEILICRGAKTVEVVNRLYCYLEPIPSASQDAEAHIQVFCKEAKAQ